MHDFILWAFHPALLFPSATPAIKVTNTIECLDMSVPSWIADIYAMSLILGSKSL